MNYKTHLLLSLQSDESKVCLIDTFNIIFVCNGQFFFFIGKYEMLIYFFVILNVQLRLPVTAVPAQVFMICSMTCTAMFSPRSCLVLQAGIFPLLSRNKLLCHCILYQGSTGASCLLMHPIAFSHE